MPYWVKRIVLKSGELVTEHELGIDQAIAHTTPIVIGDVISVVCRGRTFPARVVWGDWPGRDKDRDPSTMVPLRVEEL